MLSLLSTFFLISFLNVSMATTSLSVRGLSADALMSIKSHIAFLPLSLAVQQTPHFAHEPPLNNKLCKLVVIYHPGEACA